MSEKSPNTWLTETIYKSISNIKKGNIKVKQDLFMVPKHNEYNNIIKYNYNVQQLKQMCKHYGIKQSGNKNDVMFRIYNYLKFSFFATIIQSNYRGYLQRKLNKLKGYSLFNRNITTNKEDFISLDTLIDVHPNNYFSYNINQHNYGFNLSSIYNLILKSNIPMNPYTREIFSNKTIFQIKEIIRLSKILKISLDLNVKDVEVSTNNVKFRIIELFHKIDSFGNLSNFYWFYSLNKQQLIRLYRELYDIWNYRIQLTSERKKQICHPTGNPFVRTDSLFLLNYNIEEIRKHFINIFNNLLTKAIDNDYQSLGAYYILGALTIVNNEAAESLPWLYESFHIH